MTSTPALTDPLEVGGCTLPNRLYRAPLLECAGTDESSPDRLLDHLEPAAAAGAGLVCQGATIVTPDGGCAAPNMTRVHDESFVASLRSLTDRLHDHGARVAIQLEDGGLRSMETWHAGYRRENPGLEQRAVSRPPGLLRALDRIGFLEYDAAVLETAEVHELAAQFGRSAAAAVDAGYDVVHLAGANMGIVQQFLSPYYNRRDDEFGDGVRFLELVHDEIRDRAGGVPLMTKVPAETEAPPFVRRRLEPDDAVRICERLDAIGFDGLVPVRSSVFWDMSVVRGEFPGRAWRDERFREGYDEAFGGRGRTALVALGNWLESFAYEFEPAWNADLCRQVRGRVSVPVFLEGGVRSRDQIDSLLGDACDAVGMGRPFYAEPRFPARLLTDADAAAVCESCNNCTVPQAAGADGVCRTPSVLQRAGELRHEGAYERPEE